MGYVTCSPENHPELHKREVKCCWGCDRCPRESGFRLQRGDYCPDCTAKLKKEGYIWSDYCQDYVKPKEATQCVT